MVTEEELERDARILIESTMHVEPTFEDETQIWRLFSQPLLAHPSAARTFIRGPSDCQRSAMWRTDSVRIERFTCSLRGICEI
jgi:hypothetical protein